MIVQNQGMFSHLNNNMFNTTTTLFNCCTYESWYNKAITPTFKYTKRDKYNAVTESFGNASNLSFEHNFCTVSNKKADVSAIFPDHLSLYM